MIEISRLHELFDVDDAVGGLLWKESRGCAKAGDLAGTLSSKGYLRVKVDGIRVMVHRAVLAMATGRWPTEVDHIDGCKTNNRLSNLREATRSQNSMNRAARADCGSGLKGVSWCHQRRKWKAFCSVGGKRYYFGAFLDMRDAAAAAKAGRDRHHKEFARHG